MKPRSPTFTPEHLTEFQGQYEGGVPKADIVAWAQRLGYSYTSDSLVHMASNKGWRRAFRVPTAPTPRFDKPIRIDEDALILPDCHCPYHDSRFIEKCCEVALVWGIKTVVMDGDGIDVGWLSSFEPQGEHPPKAEVDAWRDLTDALLERFTRIVIHYGNHSDRIRRSVQRMPGEVRDLLGLIAEDATAAIYVHRKEMEFTDYSWLTVHGVRVVHPSATGVNTGQYLSEANECDTVLGHTHYRSITWSKSDRWMALETGGCFDPRKMRYVSARAPARARGRQRQGAAIIAKGTDGRPYIYHLTPRHTDFERLARLGAA